MPGIKRRNDIAAKLDAIVNKAGGMTVTIEEVDLCRGREHDLLDPAVWARIESSLRAGTYQMVLASPPCNTWSRSTLNPKSGPRPLRSSTHLWGFPWLSGPRKSKLEEANALMRITLDALGLAAALNIPFLLEHPEDLGRHRTGESPASIWRLP